MARPRTKCRTWVRRSKFPRKSKNCRYGIVDPSDRSLRLLAGQATIEGSGCMSRSSYTMKPIGILYATRNGHTRRIAEHIASDLHGRGLDVELKNVGASGASIHPLDYSAAV